MLDSKRGNYSGERWCTYAEWSRQWSGRK